MLQQAGKDTLGVRDIARHLHRSPWTVTRELSFGAAGLPGRLRGTKVAGPSRRGAGGQWQVERQAYLDWLGVPAADRDILDEHGLPVLHTADAARKLLNVPGERLRALLAAGRTEHLRVGYDLYLTAGQLRAARELLARDCRDESR